MMKRILGLLIGVFCSVLLIGTFAFGTIKTSVNAENVGFDRTLQQIEAEIDNELKAFIEYGEVIKVRGGRIAGSSAEYQSAKYIHEKMSALSNFVPVEDSITNNGYQFFDFVNYIDGKRYSSQNVVFKRESNANTNKKVVLGAHYDSLFVPKETNEYSSLNNVNMDGINDNASSVAMLLTLAKYLDGVTDYGYDIEFVFFGAGANGYVGAEQYVSALTDEKCKDILLMLNFDRIALGDHKYIYINEFETIQDDFLLETLGGGFKKLKTVNTIDYSKDGINGLNYSHIGLESDHIMFMNREINTINFFSGHYEDMFTFGLSEYDKETNITFTEKDNYDYIKENKPEYITTIAEYCVSVNNLLSNPSFVMEMEKDSGAEAWYKTWTNEKFAIILTIILLFMFILIYEFIYVGLNRKSRRVMKENNIDKIVFRITSNLGDVDGEITEVIDQKVKDDTGVDDDSEDVETEEENKEQSPDGAQKEEN